MKKRLHRKKGAPANIDLRTEQKHTHTPPGKSVRTDQRSLQKSVSIHNEMDMSLSELLSVEVNTHGPLWSKTFETVLLALPEQPGRGTVRKNDNGQYAIYIQADNLDALYENLLREDVVRAPILGGSLKSGLTNDPGA
ncbi:MAG: hypothetical protein EOM20_02175 [Spartobacteria bacterium]|nr:hypothetical protein [Spartobacteria bacterium]